MRCLAGSTICWRTDSRRRQPDGAFEGKGTAGARETSMPFIHVRSLPFDRPLDVEAIVC